MKAYNFLEPTQVVCKIWIYTSGSVGQIPHLTYLILYFGVVNDVAKTPYV